MGVFMPPASSDCGRNSASAVEGASCYAVETTCLTKAFDGFVAVGKVDLKVRRGAIHALIGPNGAGKTTCFNLISKFMQPSDGRILLEGNDITDLEPFEVARLGMVRSFQISSVFPDLSVLDNVKVSLQKHARIGHKFWLGPRSRDVLDDKACALLREVELDDYARARAAEISYGRKRALEIATTLALEPSVLLLDEPTAGMSQKDVGTVTALIRRLSSGRTILLVEHNLAMVESLCDRITVLARGEIIAEGSYSEVAGEKIVKAAYLGTDHD
jgi:branched-chain amino acid transport system ATP-binding protein